MATTSKCHVAMDFSQTWKVSDSMILGIGHLLENLISWKT